MKDKTFCCSFTGHRPAKLPFIDEKTAGCVALKNRLFKEIKDMVYSGISTFYSGMAQGVDICSCPSLHISRFGNMSSCACSLSGPGKMLG